MFFNTSVFRVQFCILRQTNPSEMPSGATHWELWISAQSFNNSRYPKYQPMCKTPTSSVVGLFVPRGFCRKFHRGNDCSGCNFKHQCFKCGVVHAATRCNFCPSRPALHSTPSAVKSRTANPSSN